MQDLRTTPEMQAEILRRAEAIAEACGEGFVAEATEHPTSRARAAVIAVTPQAIRSNGKHNTILNNLDAGR